MSLIPAHFLIRLTFACPYVKVLLDADEKPCELPDSARIDVHSTLTDQPSFADVRLAWNEQGIGVGLRVKGKDQAPVGDVNRPRGSDGMLLWLDTRDTRNIHRASRYCHQFFFLPAGGGRDLDQPVGGQLKINRALQDAALADPSEIPLRLERRKGGYQLWAFLRAAVLTGYDPETNPRLGFYYAVRDLERGEQTLGLGPEFPYWEDPSLWSTLELAGGPTGR
jgi:hypothetical protein